MLVLSRKIGEVITIGKSITITVLGNDRGIIRLGIEAPKNVPVHRKEIFDKIVELNQQATKSGLSALKKAISDKRLIMKKNKQTNRQFELTKNIIKK